MEDHKNRKDTMRPMTLRLICKHAYPKPQYPDEALEESVDIVSPFDQALADYRAHVVQRKEMRTLRQAQSECPELAPLLEASHKLLKRSSKESVKGLSDHAKDYQLKLKAERLEEERRMEMEFKMKMAEKFAEDERLE